MILLNIYYFAAINFLLIPATILIMAGFINKKNFTLGLGLFFAVLAYIAFEINFRDTPVKMKHIIFMIIVTLGTGIFVKFAKDWKQE